MRNSLILIHRAILHAAILTIACAGFCFASISLMLFKLSGILFTAIP
jgi:hypothetical protein